MPALTKHEPLRIFKFDLVRDDRNKQTKYPTNLSQIRPDTMS